MKKSIISSANHNPSAMSPIREKDDAILKHSESSISLKNLSFATVGLFPTLFSYLSLLTRSISEFVFGFFIKSVWSRCGPNFSILLTSVRLSVRRWRWFPQMPELYCQQDLPRLNCSTPPWSTIPPSLSAPGYRLVPLSPRLQYVAHLSSVDKRLPI